ncbi:hypothetical protein PR202_ga20811 [Eleusine coracana subsp. coracana]|uniref:Uncharacterized protein n=1 Tax=Eleusine coracana subsp. coracana TaxID=191504 RepID=A0AAV5CXL1_ELECO|nr:hypothetical protein PR202_ga20811 [Eleusine coracana subsp. coracana]
MGVEEGVARSTVARHPLLTGEKGRPDPPSHAARRGRERLSSRIRPHELPTADRRGGAARSSLAHRLPPTGEEGRPDPPSPAACRGRQVDGAAALEVEEDRARSRTCWETLLTWVVSSPRERSGGLEIRDRTTWRRMNGRRLRMRSCG